MDVEFDFGTAEEVGMFKMVEKTKDRLEERTTGRRTIKCRLADCKGCVAERDNRRQSQPNEGEAEPREVRPRLGWR